MSTLTYHVVPCRDDEFLLLVMSGSALLVVMLRSRNRSSRISEIQRATMTWVFFLSSRQNTDTSRCWIFLSFSVSWFFSAWISGVAVTGCLGSRVLITCAQKGHFLTSLIWHCPPLKSVRLTMDSLKHIVFIIPHIVLPCQNQTPTSTEMLVAVLHYGQRCRCVMLVAANV